MSERATPTGVDHEVLLRNTIAKLASLSSLKISRSRIKTIPHGEVVVGGFGDVRQAKLRTFLFGRRRVVAVKTLRPSGTRDKRIRDIAALARELDVWTKLKHPNVLILTGFYFDEMSLMEAWVVTPWQKNGNASQYLEARNPDHRVRLKLALETACGLMYLHSLKPPVCHGDIKAENTLIDDHGNARLCDFGLATILDAEPTGLTTMNTAGRSLRYAAPELVKNDQLSHSLQSDVWAWGCLVLVLMTDVLPYGAQNNEHAIANTIRNGGSPADVSTTDLQGFICDILTACWEQVPSARPTISWCWFVVSTEYWPPFSAFVRTPLSKVPLRYKSQGNRWHVIHNPALKDEYEYQFVMGSIQDVRRIDFSPDGRHIAVIQWANQCHVRLYDVDIPLDRPMSVAASNVNISALRYSHGGPFLATGHEDGVIRIWQSTGWAQRHELRGHRGWITCIAWAKSDTRLISTSAGDGTVRSWNAQSGTIVQVIPIEEIWDVRGSPHHTFFVASGLFEVNVSVRVCDTEHGITLATSKSAEAHAFMPDGRSFISGNGPGSSEGLVLRDRRLLSEGEARDSASSPDAAGFTETTLDGPQTNITSLAITQDGRLAASGSRSSGDLLLWDLAANRPMMKMRGEKLLGIAQIKFRPGSTASEGTVAFTHQVKASNERQLQLLQYKCS